jgi:hypothetical protein
MVRRRGPMAEWKEAETTYFSVYYKGREGEKHGCDIFDIFVLSFRSAEENIGSGEKLRRCDHHVKEPWQAK